MVRKSFVGLVILFILLLNSFPHSVAAQTCPSLPPALETAVQRTLSSKPGDLFVVLKNGLTVLTCRKPDYDVVSVKVFVRAGSIYEGKYLKAGLSHYLEHVLSGGTTRSFTEAQARERLERIGGTTNASTTYDNTVYYINTSPDHWKDALDLLLSYVSENTLDPREVSREKSVIQQEIKMGENNPGSELWKLFIRTAYQVHPVKYPVTGYEDVFVQVDRDALQSYYLDRYQPENIVVSIAGNIVPDEVLDFVAQKTRDFTGRAAEPPTVPVEPQQTSPRWQEKEVPITRMTQVMVGFPSVSLHENDLYALDLLSFLLGEGETCRLHCRLKEQENKVFNVSASNWTPSFARGQFFVSITLPPDQWPAVLSEVIDEIDILKKDLVSETELEKAKKATIAHHVFGMETVSSVASSIGSSYINTGDPYFDDVYTEKIRKVTPEEIRAAARQYLLMDRSNIAVIKPAAPRAKSAESAAASLQSHDPSLPELKVLPDGLRVLLKKDPSLPMVTVHLYGRGGLVCEDPGKPGISAFTSSLLTAGTIKRTKLEILRSIEDVGGTVETGSDNNTFHISIKILKEDIDTALDILSDILQNSQFPQEEMERRRTDTLLAIQRLDENWQSEVVRLFKKDYFQNSSYRNDRVGTPESVKSFSRQDLLEFYHRMVNPKSAVLAVYGDIDSSAVLSSLTGRLENWKGREVKPQQPPDETRRIASDKIIEKKNEKSSAALFVGTNGIELESAQRQALDVLDAVLSGAGNPGGRIFEALRGKENLVYVVGASPFYGKKAGFFGVLTQTTLANLDKVQGTILEHLRSLCDKPVPPDELEKAKNGIVTVQRLRMESLDAQAQSAAVNEAVGLGWKFDKEYIERIKTVTAEDVQTIARQLFTHTLIVRTIPEHPVEVLACPPAKSDVHTQ